MRKEIVDTRVPQIIILYWIIKIASTTLGETGADMFSMTFQFGYAATIMIFMTIFLLFFAIKLSLKRYEPITYWLTFTATAIAGTAISDFIDRTLELGYSVGSLILVSLLGIVLYVWHKKDRSLSVEKIYTTSSEVYYWIAFLIANTLGTAAGDFLADDLNIGFVQSATLISLVLISLVVMNYYTKISKVFLFWLAFVLTRPFGATFGDLLTKPIDHGGLNLGTVGASSFFMTVLVIALFLEINYEKINHYRKKIFYR
ncbi:hypothetical protein [Sulfurimonas sp. HSL-1716]|uniref:COG4705 family protein n=1 Tax=Hydrocurvibacter sulfurireducens TaxID=3131937 RepID=UPI0031F7A5A8